MKDIQRTYFCIDMKCFFASVECAERGLNPFETNLVVADETRGKNALCLAISPKMKALGVKNRCRMSEIPKHIEYIVAKPRMQKYINYAADIYDIYLDYISPSDIHVYSIDESFLDVTDYLKCYNRDKKEFAKFLINEIAEKLHIPSTAGIGTNLYLAKVALDITAKKSKEHIGILNEEEYRKTLWHHRPITDFWQIAGGIAKRLARYGIVDMEGIATASPDLLYKEFGINAELLIDHSLGKEPCTIADIKAYKPKSKSVNMSQILFEDYSYEKAYIVVCEMALAGCQELIRRQSIARTISLSVGYSKDLISPTGGSIKMVTSANTYNQIKEYIYKIYKQTTIKTVPIRRLSLTFDNLADESSEGYQNLHSCYSTANARERSDCSPSSSATKPLSPSGDRGFV